MSKSIRSIVDDKFQKSAVSGTQSVRQVIDYMGENNVGAVAVCDGDQVIGVFSERDLLRRVVRENRDLDSTLVQTVMSTPVYWILEDERYEVAKAIMVDHGVHHLVVLDENRDYKGFVSSRECLQADLKDSRELVGKLNDEYYEHRFQH